MTEQQTQCRAITAMLDAIAQGGAAIPPTMVVQAHPDDEVIALGSRLASLRSAIFVHVTDGAPRDGVDASVHGFTGAHMYARARRHELEAAMALAGVGIEQLHEISCPDQQAAKCLVALSRQIAGLIARVRPKLLITHPYEGGHPDHDATAFAVHAACALLASQGLWIPELAEASSYHNSPVGLEAYCFIPPNTGASWNGQVTIELSEQERELKSRMLARAHDTAGNAEVLPGRHRVPSSRAAVRLHQAASRRGAVLRAVLMGPDRNAVHYPGEAGHDGAWAGREPLDETSHGTQCGLSTGGNEPGRGRRR